MKIVICTGGYDPLHSGHLESFKAARELGDMLLVGVNSDAWLTRKKGRSFMPWRERAAIVQAIKYVTGIIEFNDDDGTAIDALEQVKQQFPQAEIIFANGGDRTAVNIPEMVVKDVVFKFGVGGENKANSSSWILEEWKAPKTERVWGYYRNLHDVPGLKVKELTVEPGKTLSMQRHDLRAEYWIVSEGTALVEFEDHTIKLQPHESTNIPVRAWHRLFNPFETPVKVVEIQYGVNCIEEDIERK